MSGFQPKLLLRIRIYSLLSVSYLTTLRLQS
nr:MAG TPA: hypothetical protein [Caudoviricetes sp.]